MQDADAFAALYDREAQTVLVFIARRTLDAELALDLTAETFAQAFRGRRSFRGSTEMEERAWLYTIARRQIARYHRRGGVERRALRALAAEVPAVHEDDIREIEEAAGLGELRAALGDELQRLSRNQREALRLRVVEDLPYPEVASSLGVTEATARARVSRGLRALAAALELRSITEGDPL
jgi:RNA polymerase sigma factor (sigma-70 family)